MPLCPSPPQKLGCYTAGKCLEWIWHHIFGQPWVNYPPDVLLLCPGDPTQCLTNINFKYPYVGEPDI